VDAARRCWTQGDSEEKEAAGLALGSTTRDASHLRSTLRRHEPREVGTLGHVTKRSGKWQATYRGPDGRERTKTFAKKNDADRWLATNGADIARGSWIDPRAGEISLATYSKEWLATRSDLRPSTAAKYKQLLDDHILPALGTRSLSRLSPSAVRGWRAELGRRYPTTAATAYRLLSTICRTAVNDELIARTPCKVAGGGTEKTPERPVASVAEVSAAADAAPSHWRLAVLLASWCQLRRGEVLGLQRGDVDVLHRELTIDRQWSMAGSTPMLGPPKTDAGQRRVTVPPNILPALIEHLAAHVGPRATDWLFAGADGQPSHPRTVDHAWSKARKMIGRTDLRFHDLRHSGLTWAATTGASTKELMRRAGHASPQAALRYQHATDDRDRALADALGALAEQASVVSIDEARGRPADKSNWRKPGRCSQSTRCQGKCEAAPTGFEPVSPP